MVCCDKPTALSEAAQEARAESTKVCGRYLKLLPDERGFGGCRARTNVERTRNVAAKSMRLVLE